MEVSGAGEKEWWKSSWSYEISVVELSGLVSLLGGIPEVGFVGRSNVGKSSLINGLLGGKYARTSRTPGRTQALNFFRGRDVRVVDMPGYGYAVAPKSESSRWQKLVRGYLRGRRELREVCLLVDSRFGLKEGDREMMGLMDEGGVGYRVVLTKSDKLRGYGFEERKRLTEEELKKHTAARPEVLGGSALKGRGFEELREKIGQVL
jgi:GTP-binding protein